MLTPRSTQHKVAKPALRLRIPNCISITHSFVTTQQGFVQISECGEEIHAFAVMQLMCYAVLPVRDKVC